MKQTSTLSITRIGDHTVSLRIATDAEPYIGTDFVAELAPLVETIKQDETLHAVVVEGASQYFSAGANRRLLIGSSDEANYSEPVLPGEHVFGLAPLLLSIPVPTIAAMEGHAIGGGFLLGLWCDVPILAEESLYGMNFMALGFTPGPGSIVALEEAVGAPMMRELILTGRLVSGRELKAKGSPLAHAIVPKEQVRVRVMDIAFDLESVPRPSLVLLKQVLAERRRKRFDELVPDEIAMQRVLFSAPETRGEIADRYLVLTALQENGS